MKTVNVFLIGTRATRLFIDGRNNDVWLIIEQNFLRQSARDWNNEWSRVSETPSPYTTNSDIDRFFSIEIANNKYIEDNSIQGRSYVLALTRNLYNQDSWWEERKYFYFLQNVYIIVE
ncbi:MAG: hypothetical protein FWG29_11630 [Treponema sp.]|nr:hypothetical protein [Treponema sp.]